MSNYAHAVSAKAFPIAYKCHYCGKYNCELSTVAAEAKKKYSLLGTSLEEAKKIATENAYKACTEKVKMFIQKINDEEAFGYINSAGICHHCGKKQCWSSGKKQSFRLNLYAFIIFLIIIVPLIVAYEQNNYKICLYMLLTLPIFIMRRVFFAIKQKKIDLTISVDKDPQCFPVACEIEKANINSADDRIRYIAIQRDIEPALTECFKKAIDSGNNER